MYSTIRLIVFFVVCSVLLWLPQPVHAQEENPDLQRGIADLRQGNYEEALESFLKVSGDEPKSSVAAYFLGVTYKNLQDYEKAEKHLKEAFNLEPRVKEAILELAEVQFKLDKLSEALTIVAVAEGEGVRPGQTAFLKGRILAEKGDNLAAIESFEKAKELNSGLVQGADYQIGLLNLKQGKFEKAAGIFNAVLVKDPNTEMAAFAKYYLDKINRREKEGDPLQLSFGLYFQYDDNVVLRPGDTSAVSITDDDDYKEVLTAGVEYLPETSGPWDYNLQYSLYLSNHHSIETHDVMSHTFVLVPSYKLENGTFDVAVSYNHNWVDYEEYLRTISISPAYTRMFGTRHVLQTSLSFQNKDFLVAPSSIDEDRDSDEIGLNLNWYYYFAENKGYFNLVYKLNKEDTDGDNWEYIGNRAIATVLIPYNEKTQVSLSGEVKYQDFQNLHTTEGKERRDITYKATSLLSYKLYRLADLQLMYVYIRDNSNIAAYDYDRQIFSAGVGWNF